MINMKIYFYGFLIIIFQSILSEFLSINGIRPDFILIYLIYVSVQFGSTSGVIIGFILGIISDLLGVGTSFGLSPLTYTFTGYLTGIFCINNRTKSPFQFHTTWLTIVIIHFLLSTFIRYQSIFIDNSIHYITIWILTTMYTLGFIGILQIVKPLHRRS